MRIAVLAFTFALAAPILGQTKATINVPPGDVVVFASKGLVSVPPASTVSPEKEVAEVPLSGQDTLYVWDRTGNRTVHAPVRDIWSPKLDELKNLAQVVIELRRDGKPVAAANLTVDDGRKHEIFVDPSLKGDATAFDIKPGSLKVTVNYRAAGKDAAPVTQIFEVKSDGDAIPHFTVALPEAAEIVGPPPAPPATAATSGGTAATPAKEAPASGGGFNFVGTLFALIVGGAVAAGAWYFIKKNPGTVGGTLEKLGAQIPKPGDAPLADPAIAPAPPADPPAPPQKIVLDPSPEPIQVAPAPISVAPISVSVSEPSLVSDSGIPIPLAEGETVVGREVGLGLSLAGETTVSRRHATINRAGNSVMVEDAGSTNGTFVNGVPVHGSVALKPGDAVQFGSVRFRYEG